MTNYFSHDHSARNDIKLQKLIMEMNYEGLGFFWCIVEMLYEQGGKIELSQCQSIAFALRTDSDKIKQVIDLVFEQDDTYFWSESILNRLKIQKEKSKLAKISAEKRWDNEAKKGIAKPYAKAMPTHSEGNAIKEKKRIVKNNKIKDIISVSTNQITEQDLQEISDKYKIPLNMVQLAQEEMNNWLSAKGKHYKDYKAGLRNWVLRDAKKTMEGRVNGKSRVSIDITKL